MYVLTAYVDSYVAFQIFGKLKILLDWIKNDV